jgi:hypothetical protein
MKPSMYYLPAQTMPLRGYIRPFKNNDARMKIFSLFFALLFITVASTAQPSPAGDQAAAYTKTLNERVAKIVAPLEIIDASTADKVQAIIVQQYRDLNAIHDGAKARIKTLKEQAGEGNKPGESAVNEIQEASAKQLKALHEAYISKLSALLTSQQVDKVKDGMTYNVLNVTYAAYQEKIPTLTDTQKNKIYEWLKEARELAMDEGASEDKHKVFGKYKGRINNYLSSEGYDLKKEEKDWQERLRKKREQNKG